jgi:hypothetical protein
MPKLNLLSFCASPDTEQPCPDLAIHRTALMPDKTGSPKGEALPTIGLEIKGKPLHDAMPFAWIFD